MVRSILGSLTAGLPGLALAAGCCADVLLDQPLSLSDRQPLAQIFGLPGARSGLVVDEGVSEWRAAVDLANNFVRDQHGAESLVLDGESQRIEIGVRHGLGNGWEVGFTLPWIAQNGGALDNFIDDWHRVWGLPDGGRPDYRRRQLQFDYRRNGVTELDFTHARSGIGDLQLNAAYQLLSTPRTALSVAATLTLPTGDADDLTGTGAGSASVALAVTRADLFDLPVTLTANVGGSWLPRGDVLEDRQRTAAWFAAGELSWAVAQDWRLKAQLNAHSALYDSELTTLGSDSLQLLLGGSVRLSPRWVLDAAIGEDIVVDTAPDVTFQLALRSRF